MKINNLIDILQSNLDSNPDRVCCIFPRDGESKLTYRELDKKSNTFAEMLSEKGIKKGDHVLVITTNIPEALIIYYGIMKTGAVLVSVKPGSSQEEISALIDDSGAKLLIYESMFREDVEGLGRDIIMMGIRTPEDGIYHNSIEENDTEFPAVSEEDPVIVLYTSGSTGKPKGAVLTHKNFTETVKSIIKRGFFEKGDNVYCVQPLYYIDQTIFLHTPFMLGGTSHIVPRFSKSNFWKDIKKYNIDYVSTVPVMQRILLTDKGCESDGHSLRVMFSTGQHLPLDLMDEVEDRFNVRVVDCYGMTEGTGFSTFNYLEDGKRKKGSIGKTLSCCRHKVIDKKGRELPANKIGELMLKGYNQIRGYLCGGEATKELFDEEGWMHTGDLGYYDEEGFYYVVGRTKNLIIKGGENISSLEVEGVINQHPKIADCCAVPIPDEIYGEEIGCLAVSEEECTEEEVIRHCLEKKGKLKTPKKIFFVPEIPKTSSGKHDLMKSKDMVMSLIQ